MSPRNHRRLTDLFQKSFLSDHILEGHLIKTVHEQSFLDCSFACLETDHCQSYNAREETVNLFECELNNSTKTLSCENFVAKSGFKYYGTYYFPKVCYTTTARIRLEKYIEKVK